MCAFERSEKGMKFKMKIGIDIDNCISNFDDVLLKEYLKHDKELRNTGIINENPEYLRIGMSIGQMKKKNVFIMKILKILQKS